jgi:hypothetical protein
MKMGMLEAMFKLKFQTTVHFIYRAVIKNNLRLNTGSFKYVTIWFFSLYTFNFNIFWLTYEKNIYAHVGYIKEKFVN